MNIVTFDIEEWSIAYRRVQGRPMSYKVYDEMLDSILCLLDDTDTKATFFCLGDLAVNFPYVVKKIHNAGHEIGCHSNIHQWLNRISKDEVYNDTRSAIHRLEDLVGEKFISYRAPAFSIGENNKWAFEVLWECGIRRDASIFPANRDIGGYKDFGVNTPCIVEFNGYVLHEFPIRPVSIMGHQCVYSGGGYFRVTPFGFIRYRLNKDEYSMFYFHIADLLSDRKGIMSRKEYEEYFLEDGTLKRRLMRWIRSNARIGNTHRKLRDVIANYDFVNISKADAMIDWDQAHRIVLY